MTNTTLIFNFLQHCVQRKYNDRHLLYAPLKSNKTERKRKKHTEQKLTLRKRCLQPGQSLQQFMANSDKFLKRSATFAQISLKKGVCQCRHFLKQIHINFRRFQQNFHKFFHIFRKKCAKNVEISNSRWRYYTKRNGDFQKINGKHT